MGYAFKAKKNDRNVVCSKDKKSGFKTPITGGLNVFPRFKTPIYAILGLGILSVLVLKLVPSGDFLSGLSNDTTLGMVSLQLSITLFCLTPGGLDKFETNKIGDDHWDPTKQGTERNFAETGETREDEYEKASIYAFLYGLYQSVGLVRHTNGELYEFTFNTWGISNPNDKPFGPEEPQRHGRAAYYGLASFDTVKEYVKEQGPGVVEMLEIGCGTGAGANLISSVSLPTIKRYNALDMQLGGIERCRRFATENPRLNCVHGNGMQLPFADSSQDIIVVSETHIAEMQIGEEEKVIFSEMIRVLKPNGLFIWGNALPTKVWGDGERYLTSVGFELVQSINHTASAVKARDEDKDRVDLYVDQAMSKFPVYSLPYFGERCAKVSERMLKNFYRHPGTDLYQRMVAGDDSYMHQCYKLIGK